MEAVLTVILASAWSFIARQTVYASFFETMEDAPSTGHWIRLLMCQYHTSLALYAMRMMTYFVYDTSLVAQSISRLQSSNTNIDVEESVKEWHSIILVFTCAFRGSLARFFYSKLYQGVMLPKVCDNVPVVIGNREIGVRDLQGGRQHVVPWLTQGEEDRLLASSSHSGFDQTKVNSDDMNKAALQTKELDDIVIVTNYGTIR
ncbi:unnamed protein product [Owenia fusiformis]|uniref:Uncharacterized protein n=1 Tax=Owenia fusiformis TaxID=6347 RepID=A0A8S4PNV8_OWEFU|nr:unnamed protein product [Owenia fusiformis]